MLKFALLGTGRIGKMHAENIDTNQKCKLEIVYDINNQSSNEIKLTYIINQTNLKIFVKSLR